MMTKKRLGGMAVAFALFAIGVAVLATISASRVGAQPVDARVAECGMGTPGNQVLATFDLDHASNFWQHFPAALGAPELQNEDPALVVVFNGDYTWFRTGQVFQNVVCVYLDGQAHIYPNLNLSGMNITP